MTPGQADPFGPLPDRSRPSTEGLGIGACPEVEGYEVLRVLGEGGMGVVYLAWQKSPLQRQVALKIVKPGMDSKQVIARFEAERQALALLDHPNIAHVYDAGTTKDARPYFAMEYVNGPSITEFCDERRLSLEERLALFIQVCEGLYHAHQKGLIHRDIKPSNILVSVQDDRPMPKIIDFGVAKALTVPLTDRTLVTEQDQLLGTPEYMSPEQAEMRKQDVDIRSDVYSLGAVLYELLTGVLPFDPKTLREGGIDHIRRTIQEEDPKTPSTRLSTLSEEAVQKIAEHRRTEVASLIRQLGRELEWIPLKAMRKETSQRYPSALALADDIRNYLTGVPLAAGPPSALYRLRKFTGRHRAVLMTVAAVTAAVAVGIVVGFDVRSTTRQGSLGSPGPNLEAGLVAHWKLDETEGTIAHDSAGKHDGVLHGGPQWVAGKTGGALQFDGVDDYVDLPIGPLISSLSDCTIAVWVNWVGHVNWWEHIFDFGSSTVSNMFLTASGDMNMRFAITHNGGGGGESRLNVPFDPDTGWHHVAVTMDGITKRMQLYLDGSPVDMARTRTLPEDLGNTTQNWLGRSQYAENRYYNGSLDDLRIYNRPLSREEVAELAGLSIRLSDVARPAEAAGEDANLVGWWKLDEGSGTAAYDSSGHSNLGTLFGRPRWVAGRIGGALQFGGVGDYVDCGGAPGLDITREITVAAWVKTIDAGSAQHNKQMIGKSGNYYLEQAKWDSGEHLVEFIIHDANYHGAGTFITRSFDGQWHHLAGTYDGAQVKCYVDGQLKGTTDHVGHLDHSAANVNIGRISSSPGTCFTGTIDDVRIYNRALSDAEVARLAGAATSIPNRSVRDPNLVGWWKFDEGSGTTAHDSSGNGNDATLSGHPQWATGRCGGAVSFDGVDDQGLAPAAGLEGLQQVTISAFVKLHSQPDRIMRFVTIGGAAGEVAVIRYTSWQLHFYMTLGGVLRQIRVNNVLATGVFQHVAATYDGSAMRVYLDGREVSSLKVGGAMAPASHLIFGDVAEQLDGLLDDVRIYNRALSETEIARLAEVPADSRGSSETTDPNLVGWWKLDEGSGTTAHDSSGHNPNGTIYHVDGGLGTGGSVWAVDPQRGTVLSFSGDDANGAFVKAGTIPALDLNTAFSWSFWAKQDGDGTGTTNVIIGNRISEHQDPQHWIKFTPRGFEYDCGPGAMSIWYDPIPGGVWLHHCVVKAGTSLTYYRNGVEAGASIVSKSMGENPFYLGGDGANREERWRGWLSDVRIYDRALSATEVAHLVGAAVNSSRGAASGTDGVPPARTVIQLSNAGWSRPVGTWNPATQTGTLTQDVNETIQIDSNDVTLDGNGHAVVGMGTGEGVCAQGRDRVAIKNLTVSRFENGICLRACGNCQVTGNTCRRNTASGNLFNLDGPIGGNYWSDCVGPDADSDGLVDKPYLFSGGQDNLPWTVENGWLKKAAPSVPATSTTRPAETTDVDPNLVGWWKLDETSGTTAHDSSGHGHDGTLYGSPEWISGKIGGILQ